MRALLRLADDRSQPCTEVDRIARLHLTEVERKLADLAALRTELKQLIEQCGHGTIANAASSRPWPRLHSNGRSVQFQCSSIRYHFYTKFRLHSCRLCLGSA